LTVSWRDILKRDVEARTTWPFLPSGILSKHEAYDLHKDTERDFQSYNEELNAISIFSKDFSDRQKTVLGWIFAALIGVIGNLAVSFAFETSMSGNLLWASICLGLVIALTVGYIYYLPVVSMTLRFIASYEGFPDGYEKYISATSNPMSHIILQFSQLSETVTQYGILVKTAILEHHLSSVLTNSRYIETSDIVGLSQYNPAYMIVVSTKGRRPWLDPRGRLIVSSELRNLVDALFQARGSCSVLKFELDPDRWKSNGASFLDKVADWKFGECRQELIKSYINK
jgi:hypothetical protein